MIIKSQTNSYDQITATLKLGDLTDLHRDASLYDFMEEKLRKAENRNTELSAKVNELAEAVRVKENRVAYLEHEIANRDREKEIAKAMMDVQKNAVKFLQLHDTPLEDKDVDEACDLIRALLKKCEEQKPREVSPLLKQRIENAADVLRQIESVPAYNDGTYPDVAGDRFNAVHKTLSELYDVVRSEVQ